MSTLKKIGRNLNWHLLLMIAYLVQLVLLFVVDKKDLIKSIEVTYSGQNFLTNQVQPAKEILFNLNLVFVIVGILSILIVFHLFYGFKQAAWRKIIQQKFHLSRWLINILIFSLLGTVTALILGFSDLSFLLLVSGGIFIFCFMGLIGEYLKSLDKKNSYLMVINKLIFSLFRISGFFTWLIIGLSLIAASLLNTQTTLLSHYLIYLVSLALIVATIINTSVARRPSHNKTSAFMIQTNYLIINLVFISAWVWLILLMAV